MSDVAMPRLSDSMEEGTILKWLKSDGDAVSKGEELVEIETDKANMTYEADESGTLSIVAQEGDTLAVGEAIAKIGEAGGDSPEESGEERGEPQADEGGEDSDASDDDEATAEEDEDERAEDDDEPEPDDADESAPTDEPAGNGRVKASPIARRMASDLGLDLDSVEGTGPGGRIVKSDVEAAAKGGDEEEEQPEPEREEAAASPKPEERKPGRDGEAGRGEVTQEELTRLQRTVARRMAESKATAPDFVMTLEVDMEEAVELRGKLKAAAGDAPAPSFNDFVIKASALALRDFPRANGAYRDGRFELYSRVNIGVAVAGQDALVVPTVFDADRKSLGTIAAESRRLAERVREGKITPPELSSGTFTISNLGMYGIRRFVAVINPPQAAILAVGELSPRPVVRDGEVVIRALMELTLTCDHRILYGADAAEFLAKIREYLEQPLRLAL
jgi:pyruvate dehydrogenase E2 component (dihydrolipoamide acetyltransferase)